VSIANLEGRKGEASLVKLIYSLRLVQRVVHLKDMYTAGECARSAWHVM
jgi:hypothetical protein